MPKIDYKHFSFYLVLSWLILLPLLYFPLSGDLALFLSSVKVINSGGLPYKDLVDIKPPILFYLFQAMTKVFGMGEYGVRLFDFIIQTITISLLYITILKATNEKLPAFMSGVLYSIAYVTLNINNTTQIESIFSVCVVTTIYFQAFHREKYWLFFPIAFLIGIFTGMKYTLGILLAAILFDDILFARLSIKSLVKKYSVVSIGFVIAFGLGIIPYFNPEIFQGFKEMSQYFSFYAHQPEINSESLKFILSALGTYLGDNQSLLMFSLFIAGIAYMLKTTNPQNQMNSILRISFLIAFALLMTCFIERKMFGYHLSRMNAALAYFWAFGAYSIYLYLKENVLSRNNFSKFAICIMCLFFIPLSPIPRFTQVIKIPIVYYKNPQQYDQLFERAGSESFLRIQHKQVADYINRRINHNDFVINASTGGSMINYLLKTAKISKFCQSSYYVFPQASAKHINDLAIELSQAKYLVAQDNDKHLYINGSKLSTYETLMQNQILKNIIDSIFTVDTTIGNFIIFKRLENKN